MALILGNCLGVTEDVNGPLLTVFMTNNGRKHQPFFMSAQAFNKRYVVANSIQKGCAELCALLCCVNLLVIVLLGLGASRCKPFFK